MSELDTLKINYNTLVEEFQAYKVDVQQKLDELTAENADYKKQYEKLLLQKQKSNEVKDGGSFSNDNNQQSHSKCSRVCKSINEKQDALEKKINDMQLQFQQNFLNVTEEIHAQINDGDQYNRKRGLLFHRITNLPIADPSDKIQSNIDFDEFMVKTINTIMPNLKKKITLHDISTSHVLPTKNKKITVVLVVFTKLRTRNMVFFSKSCLKDVETNPDKVSISEHLTKVSLDLIKKTKESLGTDDVWSTKGIIHVKHNGEKHIIRKYSDIAKLKNPSAQPQVPHGYGQYYGTSPMHFQQGDYMQNSFEYGTAYLNQSFTVPNNINYQSSYPWPPQDMSKRQARHFSNTQFNN